MNTIDRDAFCEILSILSEEELIRFHRRAERAGNLWLARRLETELNKLGAMKGVDESNSD
jgi:hypothetical protein